MNTPSVDAEGVFFASGHTHRPAPAPASSLFVARNRREYYKLRPAKKFRQSIEMLPL